MVVAVLCALSFILNGIYVIVIYKNWRVVKRRRITYHVTNLAISDSLVGGNGFCRNIAAVAAGKITNRLSLVFGEIAWMAALTSLLTVCLMAIERLLCIKKPHSWSETLSLKRILRIMVGNWVFALLLAVLMHFYTMKMRIIFLIVCYIPIFATAMVYINVFIKFLKSNEAVDDETQQSSLIRERRNKVIQRKVGNLALILTLVLVVTMTPILIFGPVKACMRIVKLQVPGNYKHTS